MKPSKEHSNPSVKTTLPFDLNGNVVQLAPAEIPKRTTVLEVTSSSSTINLLSDTSLLFITAVDASVWWNWGEECGIITNSCCGVCPESQTITLVVPDGNKYISFITKIGETALLTITEY